MTGSLRDAIQRAPLLAFELRLVVQLNDVAKQWEGRTVVRIPHSRKAGLAAIEWIWLSAGGRLEKGRHNMNELLMLQKII